MSFGFSIGDFLAVIELASKIRKDFAGAPDQYQQISNELRNLEYTTRDIEVLLSGKTLCKADEDRLHHITKNCRLILVDAENKINNYSSLKLGGNGLKDKATRVWYRLQWDSDYTRDLRERITSSVTSFNSFNGLLTRDAVSNFAERHEHREQKRDQQEILDWLTPIDYSSQQSDFISQRQAGTCQWLLDSPGYQRWLTTNGTLFCPGIPGAGKTILASIIVDNLLKLRGDDNSVGICVIFLNFRRNNEQKLDHLIASLLKQLAHTLPAVPRPIEVLYEKYKGQNRPTFGELRQALDSVVAGFSRVFMVIDALDECQTQDNCRSRFISELLNIRTKLDVNLLATARPIPEITSKFEDSIIQEIRASDDDILRYLDGKLSHVRGPISRKSDLQAEVKEGIVQCVDGMFLLAKLHFESLESKRTTSAVRSALVNLAKGSNAYDSAYDDAMTRITGQPQDQAKLGLQTLMWIAFSERPLNVTELRHALGVELGATEFDDDNLPDLEDMLSDCCGLVTADEGSDFIGLVHYTTQKYLEQARERWFPSAQSEIAQTCITYLSFDTFECGLCEDGPNLESRLSAYPLYDYASKHWGKHAYLSSDYQFCTTFLTNTPKVKASCQALFAEGWGEFNYDTEKAPLHMTGLHLAAFFGLLDVIESLTKSLELDTTIIRIIADGEYPPIFYALVNNHVAVVELLLEMGVPVDLVVQYDPLLTHAVWLGREHVVQLLLQRGAEANPPQSRPPLFHAVVFGFETITRMLLDYGADAESRDSRGQTPLFYAIERGRDATIRVLLENYADPTPRDDHGKTPLSIAISRNNKAAIRLLHDNTRSRGRFWDYNVISLRDMGLKETVRDMETRSPRDIVREEGIWIHMINPWGVADAASNSQATEVDPEENEWRRVTRHILEQNVEEIRVEELREVGVWVTKVKIRGPFNWPSDMGSFLIKYHCYGGEWCWIWCGDEVVEMEDFGWMRAFYRIWPVGAIFYRTHRHT